MKFKYVRPDVSNTRIYGHEDVSTGDVIDLEGHFVVKATNNPDLERVKDEPKKAVKKAAPKKAAKKKAK